MISAVSGTTNGTGRSSTWREVQVKGLTLNPGQNNRLHIYYIRIN